MDALNPKTNTNRSFGTVLGSERSLRHCLVMAVTRHAKV